MILTLLRFATVLLAIVSWWSTAQGMRDYVFSQAWQANLASFAIQSILLGLNFYLPTFWRWIHSLRGKICVLALSGVVLFCSSWFSYVFIVGTVYEKSWQTESRLLVQSGTHIPHRLFIKVPALLKGVGISATQVLNTNAISVIKPAAAIATDFSVLFSPRKSPT